MKQIPRIEKYMTPMPHTINPGLALKEAVEMMRQYQIRHLPVQFAGKLMGVLTDRDIKLASSFSHASALKVDDVLTPDPYAVSPHKPLDEVVFEMAEHKYGCAIVQQENGKVVGIFTTTDGMRVLGEILQDNFKPGQK